MKKFVDFTKQVQIQSIGTCDGQSTTIYQHFILSDEKKRSEKDTRTEETEQNSMFRIYTYRFMPQFINTVENKQMLDDFFALEKEFD